VLGAFVLALAIVTAAGRDAPAQVNAAGGDRLRGAWSGSWTSEDGRQHGAADVLIVATPEPTELVGEFSFVEGSEARTIRRPGVLIREEGRFPLLGGEIALRLASGNRVVGDFVDARGELPAPRGRLELTRAR